MMKGKEKKGRGKRRRKDGKRRKKGKKRGKNQSAKELEKILRDLRREGEKRSIFPQSDGRYLFLGKNIIL